MKTKCELCGEKNISGGIFIPTEETFIGHMTGENWFMCMECRLCALAQLYGETNEEIDDFINEFYNFWKKQEATDDTEN